MLEGSLPTHLDEDVNLGARGWLENEADHAGVEVIQGLAPAQEPGGIEKEG